MGCIVFDTQCVSFTARTSVWTRLTASAQSPVAGSTAQLKSSGGQQTTEDQPGRGLKNSEKGGAAEDAAREEERRARCIRRPPGGGGALLTSRVTGFFWFGFMLYFLFFPAQLALDSTLWCNSGREWGRLCKYSGGISTQKKKTKPKNPALRGWSAPSELPFLKLRPLLEGHAQQGTYQKATISGRPKALVGQMTDSYQRHWRDE